MRGSEALTLTLDSSELDRCENWLLFRVAWAGPSCCSVFSTELSSCGNGRIFD